VKLQLVRSSPTGTRPPHVLVIVPCYNYGRYLPQCVASIVSQTGVTTDVLVIDDASSDDSATVAAGLAERLPQVRLLRHERNLGHIATYNEGLSTADSDYVVLLSADDMLAPGALGRATALMESNRSVGLVYGNPQVFVDTPRVAPAHFSTWSVWQGRNWIEAQFRRGLSIIYSPEAVVRTSVHHAAGYYRKELPHTGDLEMWLRIAAIADVGRVNGPDQAFRRVHPQSMMQTHYSSALQDLERRGDAYESFLTTASGSLPGTDGLRRILHRRMSEEAIGLACSLLERDQPADEEIGAAIDFARDQYPDFALLRVWDEFLYRSQRAQSAPLSERMVGAFSALERDLSNRVHWRRWRYFGV
jgi:hypothetical protein